MDNFTENVSKHFGLPWAGLIEHYRKTIKDKPPDKNASSHKPSAYDVTSRLHQEDASTFGLRPSLDECLLTLCDQCGAVIKSQALYSHIEKRHKETSGESSVQHLLTEKPIVKGLSSKVKNKNSPRNSPKLTANCETNLLDKYKLPKPPVNRIGGKFAPGSLEQSNSALAKQLRGGAQPVVALDDVSLSSSLTNPSKGRSESLHDLTLTPKSSHIISTVVDHSSPTTGSKQLPSKRSLDSILSAYPKSESPKKVKVEDTNVCQNEQTPSVIAQTPAILTPSPQHSSPVEDYSPKPLFSISGSETSLVNMHKQPKSPPKLHQITTFDKSIPCKDREYDPNRHCGCWLDEWGKHCTRSLTCKSHALSLRRKVPGRSKPFDTLLLEHREAKEALQLSKVKVARKKSTSLSSTIPSAKVQKPKATPTVPTLFGEADAEPAESGQAQTDFLGYSVIHPRPLAVACHGARLCGSSYVANRQLSSLRNMLKQAIEKPRQTKKLCSSKSVKSVNGATVKSSQYIHNSLPASSLTLLHSQPTAKVKGFVDKKKKAKRSSSVDVTKSNHPPFSHRLASPPSVPTSPSQCLVRSDSANILKSGSSGAPSTINLLTNGTSTQLIRANLLNDGGVWSANRQKGIIADTAKAKLAGRNSIPLPVNASSVATLSNKHLTLLDGHPYTLYSTSGTAGSTDPSRQPVRLNSSDILAKAANGIVMQTSPADKKTDNQQAMVLEILPKYTSTHSTHLNANSMQYIKSDSNLSLTESNLIQSRNPSERVAQQFTITNSGTLSSLNSIRAMQQRQQNKASSTVTIPLGSQQPAIHHSGSTTATAHHGYG